MILHTVVCTRCGWSYGPGPKRRVRAYLAVHKAIHRMEGKP